MKKNSVILTIVLILIITLFFVYVFVYRQNKIKENISVSEDKALHDIIYLSQEGRLENGRRYKYFGTDKNSFSFQDCIDRYKLKYITNYPLKKLANTPKKAAEIAQIYFGLDQTPVESVDINVYFDTKTDNWVLIEQVSPKMLRTGGNFILTIQKSDGLTKGYSDGLY